MERSEIRDASFNRATGPGLRFASSGLRSNATLVVMREFDRLGR